jgi:hypothetical protein
MKRTLAIIFTAILIALLVIPAGTALADQDFHTMRLPIYLTAEGEAAGHTLRNGHVVHTNTEGPVNYLIRSWRLNGALPDTRYDICYQFGDYPGLTFYEYEFIQTDKNGNGDLHMKWPPEIASDTPVTILNEKMVFIEGGTPVYVPAHDITLMIGGTVAFETEVFDLYYDAYP